MKTLINSKEGFELYKPYHCWDTNYHLIDTVNKVDFLIDIHDVIDDNLYTYNLEDDGYISYLQLKNMHDIGLLISISWMTKQL